MKIKELKQIYESACNEYLNKFCNKQEITNEGWVADEVGGVALCSDIYFNFEDIVKDVNTKQPKGVIIDWYYDNLENADKSINYYSYIRGLRIKDISNDVGLSEQLKCRCAKTEKYYDTIGDIERCQICEKPINIGLLCDDC